MEGPNEDQASTPPNEVGNDFTEPTIEPIGGQFGNDGSFLVSGDLMEPDEEGFSVN